MILTYPRCKSPANRGGFPAWTIAVSILLFTVGLLALLAPRKPTSCPRCGLVWQA